MQAWLTKFLIFIAFLFAEIVAALLTIDNVINFFELVALTLIIESVCIYSVIRYPKRTNTIREEV
ncbi:MAG: hypothetical protein ABSC20_12080 [Candidatus Bathyarchaeia archaeon]|jgi:hypothetical protein